MHHFDMLLIYWVNLIHASYIFHGTPLASMRTPHPIDKWTGGRYFTNGRPREEGLEGY